jgi:hypothetical protein
MFDQTVIQLMNQQAMVNARRKSTERRIQINEIAQDLKERADAAGISLAQMLDNQAKYK